MPTLHVNATGGDDSRSYTTAQTESTPWATITRAARGNATYTASPTAGDLAAAAQAGDTVLVAAGTYTETGPTTTSNAQVALNPVNDGTSGNPITFRGVGDVYVRLAANVRGAMIGSEGKAYIIWDNFIIDDYYGGSLSDRGPVGLHAGAANCQIINCTISGHSGSYFNGYATFGGNYRLVSFEAADNNLIKNNVIHRALATDGSAGGQNEGGILMYDSDSNTIEHNEIYDCGCGIFVKGAHDPETQANNIIRYNLVHDCFHGIRVLTGADTKVYQNIVYETGATAEGQTGLYIGFGTALRSKFINNTVYGISRGLTIQASPRWAANTAYAVDQVVANGFELQYVCTTGGTSAASGDGPTGTGTSISDGTVVWDYILSDPTDVELHNNLIVGSDAIGGAIYNFSSGLMSDLSVSFTRNFYHSHTNHFNGEGIGTVNFSTWQTTHSKDVDGSSGTDPEFVNAASADFKLASNGQTSLTAGRVVESIGGTNGDTIPVGAYISSGQTEEIGLESAAAAVAAAYIAPLLFI